MPSGCCGKAKMPQSQVTNIKGLCNFNCEGAKLYLAYSDLIRVGFGLVPKSKRMV